MNPAAKSNHHQFSSMGAKRCKLKNELKNQLNNQQNFMSEVILFNTFFWAAVVLLAIATTGISYLTYLEWQDRRRRGGKN
jgi:hypothetical protein